MKKLKVLHIADRFLSGGVENVLTQTFRFYNLDQFSLELLIISSEIDDISGIRDAGHKVNVINTNSLWDFKKILEIFNFVARGGYDIVHTHFERSEVLGFLLPARARFHTYHYFSDRKTRKTFANRVRNMIQHRLNKRYDQYVAVSRALRDFYATVDCLPLEKICVIHNGIDTRRFADHAQGRTRKSESGEFVIGMVGRLHPEKGVMVLLRAVRLLLNEADLNVIIVGDGPEKRSAESFCVANKLINVSLVGRQSRVEECYSSFDLTIVPSLREGLGLAAMESLASGVPVVFANTGGIREVVRDNVNGLSFQTGSAEDLAEKILMLYHNRQKLKELASNTSLDIVDFDAKNSMKKLETEYLRYV